MYDATVITTIREGKKVRTMMQIKDYDADAGFHAPRQVMWNILDNHSFLYT